MQLESQAKDERWVLLAGLLLAVVTLVLYWPATRQGFMAIDDSNYVVNNPHVTSGLSSPNVAWALETGYAANWHPLTWISHMVDCSLFGLFAGGHHLTSILLHTLNTVMVFALWRRLTSLLWPSFIVAALFGWHPLHVESVAWISERKDVLSTLFFLLTLLCYAKYAVEFNKPKAKSWLYYALALVFFIFGLMSKPMLVTLPFLLLLLDFWPLGRVGCAKIDQPISIARVPFPKLIAEKIPFFVATVAACIVTLFVQRGAMRPVGEVTYGARAINALNAYAGYVSKAFWPENLSVYYLLPAKSALGVALCAGLLMALVTVIALRWRSLFPWFLVGWFWFVGTLVPVIGLVQVGSQAMADRYTYIPLIGLFVAVVWSLRVALANKNPAFAGGLATAVLVTCLALTHRQLGFWRDNITLFTHATNVTRGNYFAEYELAEAYAETGDATNAIQHFKNCLQINLLYEPAHYHLGIAYVSIGKPAEAAVEFVEALKRDPDSEELHNDLGVVFAQMGKADDAAAQFKQALQIDPKNPNPYVNYAGLLQQRGQNSDALANFRKALELAPDSSDILRRYALFLATCIDLKFRDLPLAAKYAHRAVELTQSQDINCLAALATTFAAAKDFKNAIATTQSALDLAGAKQLPQSAKQLEMDLDAYRRGEMPSPLP